MYPREDLIEFARQKAALRRSIALDRAGCADGEASAARPIGFFNSVRAFWKQLSPTVKMAAVLLGILVTRAVFLRYCFLRTLGRWAPLAIAATRSVRAAGAGGGAGRPASKENFQPFQSRAL